MATGASSFMILMKVTWGIPASMSCAEKCLLKGQREKKRILQNGKFFNNFYQGGVILAGKSVYCDENGKNCSFQFTTYTG